MKTKEGFKIRPLGNEFIITAEGLNQVNFNKMISLNSSAAYLWNAVVGKEFSVEDLAELLTEQYEVDKETALNDSKAIAQKWVEAGIVSE